ncbi:hypothetical protein H6G41_13365 [Tolypothrix sp. FACHB-123]|uniref:hypothetical protein n=1 Tax=Tolypothrix sp. FACHB-123 TaxID=2692868 RepID=UPI0016822E62|nr:hypothetical protein [Tolypothrix sp. FACHB-123]MBD2355593.1 hypothetical protein [Tolypothrix sp. FACHB-123]
MLPTKTQLLPTMITLSVIGYFVWPMSAFQLRVNSDSNQMLNQRIDAVDVRNRVEVENLDCKVPINRVSKRSVSQVFTIDNYQLLRLLRK